jgi:hypothetical protein
MNERDLVHSLAGVAAIGKTIKSPVMQKAAHEGLMDLCGLCLALLRRTSELERRAASLESKTVELESRPKIKYLGAWQASAGTYPEASAVSYGGSLWIAMRPTDERPSTTDSGWRLAVKAGRDGRNRR